MVEQTKEISDSQNATTIHGSWEEVITDANWKVESGAGNQSEPKDQEMKVDNEESKEDV